jgi:hypothetical protein
MASQGMQPGRTLTDADVAAIVEQLRAGGAARPPVTKVPSTLIEKQLMEANLRLAKTYGPVGRIGKRGETIDIHPPKRPKRLVMLKAGHRTPHPNPIVITEPRVTHQVRCKVKPPSMSRIPLTEPGA